ncbi:MAG TPA: hypothetical protein VGV60_07585 [Candidatus Polarisedimenticolia bacterium]|nr:hypothetical protein [Candidatus Polarisedimenticolia bacterium]
MGEGARKGVRFLLIVLVLAALAGGLYLYRDLLPGLHPPGKAPLPAPAETPTPAELPPPVLTGEPEPGPPPAPAGAVATLVGIERSVKARRAADLAWEDARQPMPLYEDDAVRTFDRSSATIAFGPDDQLEVDQNALVIIKPRSGRAGESEISLALLSSDFLDSLASKPASEQAKAIQVAAARRQITIRPGASGGTTRVALRTMPDQTTSVSALAGSLRIQGPRGGEVVLKEKMVTRVTDQGILAPRLLPGSPNPIFPDDGATYAFAKRMPQVELRWSAADRARAYRLIVATEPSFKRVFADEKVAGTSFRVRVQQPGTYYWRVRAQDEDGFAGPYSAVRSVKAVFDESPPPLSILSPPEMFVSPTPSVELKGRTEREARVRVNGQKVKVAADGTFVFPLVLKEGVNLVTVEAMDPAGNSEYGKRLITYKGSKRATAAIGN